MSPVVSVLGKRRLTVLKTDSDTDCRYGHVSSKYWSVGYTLWIVRKIVSGIDREHANSISGGERERESKRSHFVCSQSEGSCSSPLLFYLYCGSIMDFTLKTEKNFCVTFFYLLFVLGTETIFPTNTEDGESWRTGCY